ncbi:MAG: multicopper oxidase domain-containing protein [Gammaproteobacteria bacterium]|nr:multicopper oxidase domain-containing protein [Gammaproteobacteria bacterium]MDH4254875.1 multicopper oxidase domain-containing protein [Gammaproteobacteria bacterium]MDH5310598.1 multicopper oxidase domain-containing protein [Gammaproteobacteria bacterium]
MSISLRRHGLWIGALLVALLAYPPQWYPYGLRLKLTAWFGAGSYRPLPASVDPGALEPEPFCPPDPSGWRNAQRIDGVEIGASEPCVPDNPYAVAAFVRGTNNVSADTLMRSGLTADAVEKGRDLDGDGDPDEIHIRLEVAELNGSSPVARGVVTTYDIAPGVRPGIWVFAPKFVGMAVENFDTQEARYSLRLPSPAIRIEQGDTVRITLENSHYMPHTIHLHGADHGFVDASGEGNDGVPVTSEMPVMPGKARTYELTPRQSGTMFYHCHVQAHVHVQMGLQGLFVIEENRPDNWLQTLNVGAGLVRVPSQASRESYDGEYDLHYLDLDRQLGERIQQDNDPRLVTQSMHRDYDITDASVDYFTLNGRSFPYTYRESLLVADEGEVLKLRVVNGGSKGIALHTHGHKFTVTDRDGVVLPEAARAPQDVVWIATAQRVDLALGFTNDGLHAFGPGIWPFHDHQNQGVTTDGIGPGGNISAIVYREYLGEDGWPQTRGVPLGQYFTPEYYRKEVPIWQSYAPGLFSEPGTDTRLLARVLLLAVALGVFGAALLGALRLRP